MRTQLPLSKLPNNHPEVITDASKVYAGDPKVSNVQWNGKHINVRLTPYGSLVGQVPGAEDAVISLPELGPWKAQDTIPEIDPDYDDSRWTVCNKTVSVNAVAPLSLPVLYSGNYGYHAGVKVYRGRFDGQNVTGANITFQNGVAAGWSAWLNGRYVGGSVGDVNLAATWAELQFQNRTLRAKDNVLTVVTDYTGHDEDNVKPAGAQNPRGIPGAVLTDGRNFTSWKIQGNAGGEKNIDPTRGPLNEGGLYGERMGWHLPGYELPATASDSSPLEGGLERRRPVLHHDVRAEHRRRPGRPDWTAPERVSRRARSGVHLRKRVPIRALPTAHRTAGHIPHPAGHHQQRRQQQQEKHAGHHPLGTDGPGRQAGCGRAGRVREVSDGV